VDAASTRALYAELLAKGAVPRVVSTRLGAVNTREGDFLDVEVSIEATPSVLYDAVVVADGEDSVSSLSLDMDALDFVRQQYRHCKPILVVGAGDKLLFAAGVPVQLPDGGQDHGIIFSPQLTQGALEEFTTALASHRNFDREVDPVPITLS
jgi:catalase